MKKLTPSEKYRPSLYRMHKTFVVIFGPGLQHGICGFGDTPEEAYADFDKKMPKLRNQL